MSEETTREVIGISHRSKWNVVKQFLYELVKCTLKEGCGYVTVALDTSMNKQRKTDHEFVILEEAQAAKLLRINAFGDISLYQYDEFTADNILVTKENDVIIVMAKYMGPKLDYEKFFDFCMHTDSLESPQFSGSGKIFTCSDMIHLLNSKKPTDKPIKEKPIKSKIELETEQERLPEQLLFEEITGSKAVWGGEPTKKFIKWKGIFARKYNKETGKNAYRAGKPTKVYLIFLKRHAKSKKEYGIAKFLK